MAMSGNVSKDRFDKRQQLSNARIMLDNVITREEKIMSPLPVNSFEIGSLTNLSGLFFS